VRASSNLPLPVAGAHQLAQDARSATDVADAALNWVSPGQIMILISSMTKLRLSRGRFSLSGSRRPCDPRSP
jgi:hypothetical protein